MIITTRSGAVYTVRGSIWQKNDGFAQKVLWMHCVHPEDFGLWVDNLPYTHFEVQVGMKLYIGGKDEWWISTPIVSIEKEEGDE